MNYFIDSLYFLCSLLNFYLIFIFFPFINFEFGLPLLFSKILRYILRYLHKILFFNMGIYKLWVKCTIDQIDLIDFYRIYYPTAAEYILSSSNYGTFSKIDQAGWLKGMLFPIPRAFGIYNQLKPPLTHVYM